MATKISQIYDRITSLVEATLQNYIALPNPYDLESNANIYLRRGYGLVVGSAENTKRECGGRRSLRRSFNIVLTNEVVATETNTLARRAVEKSLLNDAGYIFSSIEEDPSFEGLTASSVETGDGGLVFIDGEERGKFMGIVIDINCEYFENP